MPLLPLLAKVEPVLFGAVAIGALALGFYVGIWYAARWYRQDKSTGRTTQPSEAAATRPPAAEMAKPDLADDDEYFELWERLLDACYHDFRVQAVAGHDPGFFETLHEPLISEADEDDSPLLPGEIAFGQLRQLPQLHEYWKRRRPIYVQATQALSPQQQVLFRRCLDDAITLLGSTSEGAKIYRLVVRTPGRQHVVLLPENLRNVLCIVPGPPGFDDPYF